MMKFFKDSSGIKLWIEKIGDKVWVHFKGRSFTVSQQKKEGTRRKESKLSREPYLRPPVSGRILSLKVKQGDVVQEGDVLLLIESMKIEHTLKSFHKAKIKSILVKEGQFVEAGEKLLLFDWIQG